MDIEDALPQLVAKYRRGLLRDTTKPMGVAEYQLAQALPKGLEANLPSIAQIEAELAEPEATPAPGRRRRRVARLSRNVG